ncbi:MAG: hypothetical protein CL678_04820 [Bdellovibrionaceae bacterium]|nr:hypothetical protein [Pseudobdellovibrionaceae bacterium]|tara:strand:+ start:6360 stop:7892 length:1533 start_codon:yes stop_codon:yes gene_type:complete
MKLINKSIFFSLHFLFISFAFSDQTQLENQIDELVQKKTVPTIEEMLTVLNPWPSHEKMLNQEFIANAYPNAINNIARMIVSFEKAFPGGRYFSLGRDVIQNSLALEAFYYLRGEPNRAGRFNASTPSFKNSSSETIVRYAQSLGINFDTITESAPWVLYDFSSYSPTYTSGGGGGEASQSRLTMRYLYETYKNLGKDPKDLLGKIAFVNISDNNLKHTINEDFDQENFFENVSSLSHIDGVPVPRLSTSYGTFFRINHRTSEWHDSWLGFKEINEKLIPISGVQFSNISKKTVLQEIYIIIELIKSNEFKDKLDEYLKLYKIDLDGNSKLYQSLTSQQINERKKQRKKELALQEEKKQEQLKEHLKNLFEIEQSLNEPGEITNKLSNNGNHYLQWLKQFQNTDFKDKIIVPFMQAITRARASQKIKGRDYKRLYRYVLGNTPSLSDDQLKAIRELYENDEKFRSMFEKREDEFKNSDKFGGKISEHTKTISDYLTKTGCNRIFTQIDKK